MRPFWIVPIVTQVVGQFEIRLKCVRVYQTIRCSPAMEAGVTDTLWSLDDMVRITDEWEEARKQQSPT